MAFVAIPPSGNCTGWLVQRGMRDMQRRELSVLSRKSFGRQVQVHQQVEQGRSPRFATFVARVEKGGGGSSSAETTTDKWLKLLPDKKCALYSHSLPCIEAWLRSIGFSQSAEDRAAWVIQRPDWHAQLALEITELRIKYLKSGPGNLERDVERKFSYALCREDLENAILGGP